VEERQADPIAPARWGALEDAKEALMMLFRKLALKLSISKIKI
jgi:hypothetical protein